LRPSAGTRAICSRSLFLGDTGRALDGRGAVRLPAPFPFGAEGTTGWLHAAARAFGVDEMHFRRVVAPGRERAKRALAKYRDRLEGKTIFFLPDSQLEIPLARFLAAEIGMSRSRSARPSCTAVTWPRNWLCSRPAF
jgi:light-independent protochlorophyllide reductase subunit N